MQKTLYILTWEELRNNSYTLAREGRGVLVKNSQESLPEKDVLLRGNTIFHGKHKSCWAARVQMKMKHPDNETIQAVQACQISMLSLPISATTWGVTSSSQQQSRQSNEQNKQYGQKEIIRTVFKHSVAVGIPKLGI